MKETVRLALILFLITAVSALILSVSNQVTAPIIAEADAIKNEEAKMSILDSSEKFIEVNEDTMEIIKSKDSNIVQCDAGLKDGEVVGFVFKTITSGYGGDIEFMVGISADGEVQGIEILNHEETPGLGANILKPSFQTSFEGKSIENGLSAVKEPSGDNEVQAITSATITTNSVVDEVNKIIDAYKEIDLNSDLLKNE